MRRLLTALRTASKATLAVVSLALLALAGAGAYVAIAAPKTNKPTITAGPANPTSQTGAAFTYTSKSSVAFRCSLDGGAYGSCGSGTSGTRSYAGPLAPGSHVFRVVAQSDTSTSDPAEWQWEIDTTPPPAPSITDHPSDPTAETQARFVQGDSEGGVTYRCSLDGAAGAACGRTIDYTGLGLGGHTFRVQALDRAGNASGPTAFSWTILKPPPPKPKITSGPANPTKQTAAVLTYTDTKSVTFYCSLDGGPFASCGSGTSGSRSYPGPLPDGSHTFQVRAQQSGTAMSDADSLTWTVDTVPPPPPAFTQAPPNPGGKKATFEYGDGENGVTFRCRLDAAAYASCGSSAKYNNLARGTHTFCVQALDRAGNVSTAACYTWQVGAGLVAFAMSGSPLPGRLLYPGGPAVAIDLVFTNPNGTPITIQSVTVSVSGTSAAGCGAGNFSISHQLSATPTVPANSTRSLQDLGVPQPDWPQLQMSGGGNQNPCQNATVGLAFSGTATG